MRRLMLLALPLAIACGSDNNSTTGTTLASLAGTWNLQTVNGSPLPFTASNVGGAKVEILSEVTTVSANGTFTQVTTERTTINGVASTQTLPATSGTIALTGSLVSVTIAGSGTATGTLNNSNTFTITDPTTGAIFVFVKQ